MLMLFNIYYVYCKHQCAIKVSNIMVYVVTYGMTYDIEIFISWHPYFVGCSLLCANDNKFKFTYTVLLA